MIGSTRPNRRYYLGTTWIQPGYYLGSTPQSLRGLSYGLCLSLENGTPQSLTCSLLCLTSDFQMNSAAFFFHFYPPFFQCPDLVLVHVETIGCAPGADRSSGKVSLERYREVKGEGGVSWMGSLNPSLEAAHATSLL